MQDPTVTIALHTARRIDPPQLRRLLDTEEWWPERSTADLARVLDAGPALGAWHDEQLVGFVRALGDGIVRAYVEDLLVDPGHRRQGIGSALLRRLEHELRPVAVVSLFCSSDLVPHYQAQGFRFTSQRVGHRRHT